MLGDISYRFKVPLMLSASIILTGFVVSLALTWRAYGDLRDDLFQNAVDVGGVLSNTLPGALKHDDLWQTYRILAAAEGAGASGSKRVLVVLDEDYQVYVSNRPRSFPVLSQLGAHGSELARLEGFVQEETSRKPYVFDYPENEFFYVVTPLVDDDVTLGTLIMGYPRTLFLPRFYSILKRVTYSSLIVLSVLLPFGWYLGNRAVKPLTKLAKCLGKVGRQPLEEVQCSVAEGKDEIGQLGISFRQMLQELREKQRLEHQMVASERLAAVGRLASSVAHEINNPLGGMLNAISTFRRHGRPDEVTEKTLSLLERGLEQISETIGALLVETRSESHALTPQDIDDVFTLLRPDAELRSIRFRWKNGLLNPLALPSTQVRQVLINLSLNAVQATPEGGTVSCHIRQRRNYLHIHVDNEGEPIPPERVNRLFEPFVHHNPAGSGLGLWVTYQIVQQLDGEIGVNSDRGHTCFAVQLPLELAE